jgi:hypothetical protein
MHYNRLAALLLAKDTWKDELDEKEGGNEVIKAIEEAEEAFVDGSIKDRFKRLEDILNVIHKRAEGILLLLEYVSKSEKKQQTTDE